MVVGEVSRRRTSYMQVGALGPEWSFVGLGHPNRESDKILIENTNGAVVVGAGADRGESARLQSVAALGPEWSFKGAGDFLGDGTLAALIENTNGAVVVGREERQRRACVHPDRRPGA